MLTHSNHHFVPQTLKRHAMNLSSPRKKTPWSIILNPTRTRSWCACSPCDGYRFDLLSPHLGCHDVWTCFNASRGCASLDCLRFVLRMQQFELKGMRPKFDSKNNPTFFPCCSSEWKDLLKRQDYLNGRLFPEYSDDTPMGLHVKYVCAAAIHSS